MTTLHVRKLPARHGTALRGLVSTFDPHLKRSSRQHTNPPRPPKGGWLALFTSLLAAAVMHGFALAFACLPAGVLMFFSHGSARLNMLSFSEISSLFRTQGPAFFLVGGIYAAAVFAVWRIIQSLAEDETIRLFPLHLLAGYIPLLLLFSQIDSVYRPDAMIPSASGQVALLLSMALTAVLLYPFYSAGMYYFVLRPRSPHKVRRTLLLIGVFALLGLLLLPLLQRIAPELYPSLLQFPDRL